MKIKFKWEKIVSGSLNEVRRAKVFRGWIVHSYDSASEGLSESMIFVLDPNHEWEIDQD